MNGFDLLHKMDLIDPTYLEQADKIPKKKTRNLSMWALPAACLVFIVALALSVDFLRRSSDPFGILPDATPATQQTQNVTVTDAPLADEDLQVVFDSLLFNESQTIASATRIHLPGYFTEELNESELSAVLPNSNYSEQNVRATAGFDGNGTPIEVFLEIQHPFSDTPMFISFFHQTVPDTIYTSENTQVCTLNGRDFILTHMKTQDDQHALCACGEMNGWLMQIRYQSNKDEDTAKREFACVLADFTDYENGKPDFSAVTAETIPEFFDRQLSLQEALDDAQFGAFMLREVPEGFTEESVRRYKDQNQDFLSGLWTKGLAELRWKVAYYTDADAERLTEIAQTENYDLSLYPIPRADSVPEHLREIVDNPIFKAEELTLETVQKRAYTVADAGDVEGPRIAFSVLYGNVVAEIRAKGVDPAWIYEQLQAFISE